MNDTNPAPAISGFIAPPIPDAASLAAAFSGVDSWIFDLDNTLYPPEANLFGQIEQRMTSWVARSLHLSEAEADRLRAHYWREHGTTLAGLMAEHAVEPHDYLADVHDIDFSVLSADPALNMAITSLPGLRIVHTNADAFYAGKVLAHRGLTGFAAIYGIEEAGFHPKPDPRSFAAVLDAHGIDPTRAAFFEDDPRNLIVPHKLGMRTILVGPGRHGPDPIAPETALPSHVDFQTGDIGAFVGALARGLAGVAR